MHIDRNTLSHSTYSTRFIAADEELTISYIQPIQTRADRQHLLQRWGLKCSCSACSMPLSEVEISDF
ncbi:hypothetical protein B0J12DRAFT_645626 [Macrophomina phaseolina]|uniref:SET domain-containing protein n=1 Tax=Macrophomina phaseolina TaxID=35725 RepID=A0ABQ8GRG9_9PEZI|nr:hypothetical protein B0J12DRAFT_645626 [Macrophomina phaseolina]